MRVCYGLEGFPDVHCVFSAPEGVLAGRLPLCKEFVSELQRWMEHLKKQRLEVGDLRMERVLLVRGVIPTRVMLVVEGYGAQAQAVLFNPLPYNPQEYFDELNVLLRTSSTASSGLHWEESWARLNN